MFKPPAHKSGTAGCVANDVPKELVHRGTTVYVPPKSKVNVYEEMRPLKTALQASKDVLAPYPQEPWESRYNRLVGALESACQRAGDEYGLGTLSLNTVRKIIAENT